MHYTPPFQSYPQTAAEDNVATPGKNSLEPRGSSPSDSDAPSPRPQLQRVDGKVMAPDELDHHRFGITVESIYYYPSSAGIGCAVLLNVGFMLRVGEHFAGAMLSMSAEQNISDGAMNRPLEDINISESYPNQTQWVEVSRQSEDMHTKPTFKLGMDNHHREQQSSKISLDPRRQTLEDQPTRLRWNFGDENGVFYPQSINLLVIVERSTEDCDSWFPFQLMIDCNVDVQDTHTVQQLLHRFAKPKHEGWRYPIQGSYNPDLAKEALDDARENPMNPTHVGLHAAYKARADVENGSACGPSHRPSPRPVDRLFEEPRPSATAGPRLTLTDTWLAPHILHMLAKCR